MIDSIFIELAIMLVIAVLIAGIVRLFRQPLIIGYILAGVVVSPYLLNFGVSSESVQTIAEMSVALLLFLVGLNLNPKSIKDVGKASVITATAQVIVFSIAGFFICSAYGIPIIV